MKTPQKQYSEKAFTPLPPRLLPTVKRGGQVTGFTLFEVVSVIAIMIVTGGLLLVVFNKVRQTGHQAACIGNLKNMGQALQMYIEDYRLRFPNANNWYTILHGDYLESDSDVFVCPSASSLKYGATMGYGMNAGISKAYSPNYDSRNTLFVTELSSAGFQIAGTTGLSVANRHRNGANSVFADGGVAWHLKTWFSNRDLTDTL